ncbi:protein-disulfide isomerase [Leucobacter luti]|uniref:DsbA family protein n=1 Tax=Leucobacter luti TaxID=340320 RepID=UPI001042D447|nr:thioredoxin domain-containing protein [Leucobacter luti]MCW2287354.1 protein-disulfide isomerase [Leucobacter luti]TCK41577.1 protein-disulfide isomerase [Leucobacter luti]
MPHAPETLPRHELERALRRSRTLNVVLAALAVAGLVFGGVQLVRGDANGTKDATTAAGEARPQSGDGSTGTPAATVERRIDGDTMALGALDAPVVLSEWTDFRCPFCAVYSRDTLPVLIEEYVETGKVRLEIHDVAYFGEESTRAAAAARAAGEQGHYFEFLKAVYDAAPESGHPELTPDELRAFAKTAGVPDLALFATDMERADLRAAVEQSTTQAQQLGVSGVPFFVADGKAMSGAQPVEAFRTMLDEALAAAKQ